ncbi:SH3 domain-containing protein [Leptolyngbya ohadii]|uniref:SH3 domain-containing protein n=1 Tax=Leptolyngbya ohadii TaxID=1962290 RepID=UPI0015C5CDD2|nr:SH3 domain-containing protein [Leptolyngbya ohadii]
MANQTDPNGIYNAPQPGWGLWFPRSQIEGANIRSGASNIELGGFLAFENACTQAGAGAESDYWFRVTPSTYSMGTGKVEFGCWQNGKFAQTYSRTAALNDGSVYCLVVGTQVGNGLNIRAEPSTRSRIVGTVRNGSRIEPSSFPAIIRENEGRNWVQIESPVRGWVSDGSSSNPNNRGNLTVCDRV